MHKKSQPFKALFNPSPGLNRTVREAGLAIASPVRGFRATPAFRSAETKVPKPTKRTSCPLAKASVTESVKDSSANLA